MPKPTAPSVSAASPPQPSAASPLARAALIAAVFALALAGYVAGMAPGLLWGDSAEMQILAAIGGVAHPTGYPLFTLVGRVFTAFGSGDLAWRANLVSASFAAATLALLMAFLLGRRLRALAAFAGVAVWGLSFTFWATAQRAEVYSLATFVAVGALWCTVLTLEHSRAGMRLIAGVLLGLTLAGHMAFAPWVAVAGLVLAWNVPRTGARWFADELALLIAFMVGLSPYAYLVWADQTGHGLSYLKLVELAQWPVEPVNPEFLTIRGRFQWLFLARNELPPIPVKFDMRALAKNASDTFFLLGMFEIGPLAIIAAWLGVRRRWKSAHAHLPLMASMFMACVVFSMVTSGYKILSVFLIPAYLLCAVFITYGVHELLVSPTLRRSAGLLTAAIVVLLSINSVIAHSARLVSHRHPFGPLRSQVMEEDDRTERALVPSMVHEDESRRFVESAAKLLPDSALVICEWREFMALQYLQRVEHRRTDVTLHPSGYPRLLQVIERWQRQCDLALRPVVVVSPLATMAPHLVQADTLTLATGQRFVVTHTPLLVREAASLPPVRLH